MFARKRCDVVVASHVRGPMFQKLQILLGRALRWRREELRLIITDVGVRLLKRDNEVWAFRWEDVTRVETYKRDLLSVDMICLDFSVEAQQFVYPTHDEMDGFDTLCRELARYFPSVPEDWWSDVAFPAFATNHRVLYQKPTA